MVQKLMAGEADYQFILTIRTAISSKRRRSFPRRLPTRPRSQKEARSSAGWAGATNGRKIEQTFRTAITVFLLELLFAFRFDRGWCSGAGAAPSEHTLSGFFSSAALGGAGSRHLHACRPRRAAGLDAIGPFNQRALGRRSGCVDPFSQRAGEQNSCHEPAQVSGPWLHYRDLGTIRSGSQASDLPLGRRTGWTFGRSTIWQGYRQCVQSLLYNQAEKGRVSRYRETGTARLSFSTFGSLRSQRRAPNQTKGTEIISRGDDGSNGAAKKG